MAVKIKVTQKLAVQGNFEALAIIRREVAEALGGVPTSWRWELGFDDTIGRVMVLIASR